MVRPYEELLEDDLDTESSRDEVAEEEIAGVEDEGLADSVRTYLTEMARTPLLTAEDEIRLFRVIEASEYLKALRAELNPVDSGGPRAHQTPRRQHRPRSRARR